MERIIQRRLEYAVTECHMLQGCQLGFCKGESTMEVMLKLEHIIKKCLSSREVCIIVYVDLKAAFDTVWSKGLIWKLIKGGVKGNMIRWLYEYFVDWKIKVRVEGQYSNTVKMNAGTPQGAVLSPLLFNLMVSDMPKNEFINKHIYADDITLTCQGNNLREVKNKMQKFLKELWTWTETWGFQLNLGKTFMQYYTRQRVQCPILRVIEYRKKHTILGMIFDAPLLTWKPHIDYIHAECLRRVQLMKVISFSWGMPSCVLKQFYVAYIRSKIDYGSILYETAFKSMLNKLDGIQNTCC